MITVDDFEFEFESQPYELLVKVSLGPEREAWTKAVNGGDYTEWATVRNDCRAALEDWMYEHGINFHYRTFLQADVTEFTIDNLEGYTYMKLALG